MALAFIVPMSVFASGSDSVSIAPITVACDATQAEITINATYKANNRHLVLKVDGDIVDHWNNEPASVTKTVNVGPGTHQVKAEIYLIEINSNWFIGKLKGQTRNFTISPCVFDDEDEGEEEPPIDETTDEPVEESGGMSSGNTAESQYRNLTGQEPTGMTLEEIKNAVWEIVKAKAEAWDNRK